jgi:hypothetical protein
MQENKSAGQKSREKDIKKKTENTKFFLLEYNAV